MTEQMPTIVTLTMNPAIDITAWIRTIVENEKMRMRRTRSDPGGGGINVARVLRRFGADPLTIFPMGGISGHMFEQLVIGEKLRHQEFVVAQDCRANFTANVGSGKTRLQFVMPGPKLNKDEWTAGLALTSQAAPKGYVVASGSLPRGVPATFYGKLAHSLKRQGGAKLVIDTSGLPLKHAVNAGVYLLKANALEFAELNGRAHASRSFCLTAARELIAKGKAEIVALTFGAGGAMLVSRNAVYSAKPPRVKVRGTVGAGDSFLALLVLSLARNLSLKECFRQAVAAGSAALVNEGTGLASPADVKRLARKVRITTRLEPASERRKPRAARPRHAHLRTAKASPARATARS